MAKYNILKKDFKLKLSWKSDENFININKLKIQYIE